MTPHLVTVLLPCYNAGPFAREALSSVLRQTYRDIEVLAIDDGSTDDTLGILRACAAADGRVRVIQNEGNLGLIRTLNRGVAEARGAYVARMDADDVSYPARIERQVAHLESRSDLGIVGVAADLIDRSGTSTGFHPARCLEAEAARFMALFGPPVIHAAIVARTEIMRRHPYQSTGQAIHTEDYELFTRMLLAGVAFGNIPTPLYAIRIRADSVSRTYEAIQISNFAACARQYLWSATGIDMPVSVHRAFVNRIDPSVSPLDLARAVRWVQRIKNRHLSEADSPARREIARISAEQCTDILLQAMLKGSPMQRFSGLTLAASYAPTLVANGALGYLVLKIRSTRRHRLV